MIMMLTRTAIRGFNEWCASVLINSVSAVSGFGDSVSPRLVTSGQQTLD